MFDMVAQLAALLGGPNGAQAASMLDQAGVPPPNKAMLGGPQQAPEVGNWGADTMQGYAPTTGFVPAGQNDPGAMAPLAAAGPAAPGGPDMFKLALAGNQGVKAPEPVKPLMQGGVTGGVKAPEASQKMNNAAAIAALMQTMSGGSTADPLRVPTLGSLMGGRR